MVLYNTTFAVAEPMSKAWEAYVKETLCPNLLEHGPFTEPRFCAILQQVEEGYVSYALQFVAPDRESVLKFKAEIWPRFEREIYRTYGEQVLNFGTLMDILL